MSTIIEFFVVADDAAAAAVARGGPRAELEPLELGNFDVWSALAEWESILTGHDLDELFTSGGPDVVSPDDEPLVLRVPAALTAALAQADAATVNRAAEQWNDLQTAEGEQAIEDAGEILGEVAAQARKAVRAGGALYCWIC
ncbi:hypothetical protein [Actinoplanes solisilvae]|uniref:hypothetical protein n=1 Tax=Actinoplanes solisilvae TaxID=2486853 RepID=UPI000FDC38BD|nr:hypothetical protein [Actinoplanes solisilvae]